MSDLMDTMNDTIKTQRKKEVKTMYEYELINIKTNEETILFGRDITKAMEKASLNAEEWKVLRCEYVD